MADFEFTGEMAWWRDKPDFEDYRFSPSGRRGLSVSIVWEEDVSDSDNDDVPSIHFYVLDLLTNEMSNYKTDGEIKTSVSMHYLNYYWLNESTIGTIESGERDFCQRILKLDHEKKTATSIDTRIYPHTGGSTQDSSRNFPIVFEKEVYLVYIAYPYPYLPIMFLVPWNPNSKAMFRIISTNQNSATYVFGDPIVYGNKIFFKLCSWEKGYFEFSADSIRSIDLNKKKRLEIDNFETILLDKKERFGSHRIHQYQSGSDGRYLVLYAFEEPWNIRKNIFVIDLKMLTARRIAISVARNELDNWFSVFNNRLLRFYHNSDNENFLGVYRRVTTGVPNLSEMCLNFLMFTNNRINIPKPVIRIIFPNY